jgi:hypothetical protein
MSDPIFYIVELELPDSDLDSFLKWYSAVHTPHLYEAGFTVCTSYRAIAGAMSLVDIYQAPSWDIFESAAFERYRQIAASDPHRPHYIGKNTNTRTPYHHVQWSHPPDPDITRPLVTDWITIWRFPADALTLDKVAAWLRDEGGAALRDRGAQYIRLLRKGKEAPTGRSIRPEAAIVLQWKSQPPMQAVDTATLPAWFSDAINQSETFTGYRLYPWADDPAVKANYWTGRT